jgi:hypothetical protein
LILDTFTTCPLANTSGPNLYAGFINKAIADTNKNSHLTAFVPAMLQTSFFGTDHLVQLDPQNPLIQLLRVIPWSNVDQAFSKYYTSKLDS